MSNVADVDAVAAAVAYYGTETNRLNAAAIGVCCTLAADPSRDATLGDVLYSYLVAKCEPGTSATEIEHAIEYILRTFYNGIDGDVCLMDVTVEIIRRKQPEMSHADISACMGKYVDIARALLDVQAAIAPVPQLSYS